MSPGNRAAVPAVQPSDVVVTKDDTGLIVAVTQQDKDGRILKVIAESAPVPANITAVAACHAIARLSAGWDAEGSSGPRPPLSWESVARMAMDLARAAAPQAPAVQPQEPWRLAMLRVCLNKFAVAPGPHEWESWTPQQAADWAMAQSAPQAEARQEPTRAREQGRRPLGGALAMRVLQSDLYRGLDDTERADCDELVRLNLDWCTADASGVALPAAQSITAEQLEHLARHGCGGDDTRWSFSAAGLRRTVEAAIRTAGVPASGGGQKR